MIKQAQVSSRPPQKGIHTECIKMMSKKGQVVGGKGEKQMCQLDVCPKLLWDAETVQGKQVTG